MANQTAAEKAEKAEIVALNKRLDDMQQELARGHDRSGTLQGKLQESTEELKIAQDRLQADAAMYIREKQRLESVIETLQGNINKRADRSVLVNTPVCCLEAIIAEMQAVAVGGSAATLRQTVHSVAGLLTTDAKNTLKEYTTRLRGAAEAVEQEVSTLFVV